MSPLVESKAAAEGPGPRERLSGIAVAVVFEAAVVDKVELVAKVELPEDAADEVEAEVALEDVVLLLPGDDIVYNPTTPAASIIMTTTAAMVLLRALLFSFASK